MPRQINISLICRGILALKALTGKKSESPVQSGNFVSGISTFSRIPQNAEQTAVDVFAHTDQTDFVFADIHDAISPRPTIFVGSTTSTERAGSRFAHDGAYIRKEHRKKAD